MFSFCLSFQKRLGVKLPAAALSLPLCEWNIFSSPLYILNLITIFFPKAISLVTKEVTFEVIQFEARPISVDWFSFPFCSVNANFTSKRRALWRFASQLCSFSDILTKCSQFFRICWKSSCCDDGRLFLKCMEWECRVMDNCPCNKHILRTCHILFSFLNLVIFHGIKLEFQSRFMKSHFWILTFHRCEPQINV